MAPQGLVWPCTRSIKRRLQVPRSTLMSIFWGLILNAEHPHHQHTHAHTCTRAHTLNTPWTYLLSCRMDGCDRRYNMLAWIPTGILLRHGWRSAGAADVSDPCQVGQVWGRESNPQYFYRPKCVRSIEYHKQPGIRSWYWSLVYLVFHQILSDLNHNFFFYSGKVLLMVAGIKTTLNNPLNILFPHFISP